MVVLENIVRHVEAGEDVREAALRGSAEVSFTVISMSLSLIAVFLPILLMPGIVGLLFHEFAVTLSIAILISLVISLTVTPTMAAYLLKRGKGMHSQSRWALWCERQFERFKNAYARSLDLVLDHSLLVGLTLVVLIVLNVFLFKVLPSTFFPEQDNGILQGQIIADQSISFQAMEQKLAQLQAIVQKDPAVASVAGFTGRAGVEHRQCVHRIEAARGAQAVRDPGGQPAAPQTQRRVRRQAVPSGRTGFAHRRPAVRGGISIHTDQR